MLYIMVSLVAYSSVYAVSLLCFSHADRLYDKHRNMHARLWLCIGVFVLCLFAGLRSETTGSDIRVYTRPVFNSALYASSFGEYMKAHKIETIYKIIVLICARLTKSLNVLLFVTELLVVIPMVAAASINRGRVSIVNTMTAFLFLYYPMTFNIMRQSMAAAWLVLAVVCATNKKRLTACISMIIAICFHDTAVLGIAFVILAILWMKIKCPVVRTLILIIVGAISCLLVLNWQGFIFAFVKLFEGVSEKLAYYLSIFVTGRGSIEDSKQYYFHIGTYGYVHWILRFLLCAMPMYMCRNCNDNITKLYRNCAAINFLLYSVMFIFFGTNYGYRIVMYLDFVNIFYLGEAMKHNRVADGKVKLKYAIVWLFFVGYFLAEYVVFQQHEVFPYAFW